MSSFSHSTEGKEVSDSISKKVGTLYEQRCLSMDSPILRHLEHDMREKYVEYHNNELLKQLWDNEI